MRDDICFNFHRGNAESSDANKMTNKGRDRQRIIDWFSRAPDGDISDHVEKAIGMRHQTCSARISELKRDGLLVGRLVNDKWLRRPTSTGAMARVLFLTLLNKGS